MGGKNKKSADACGDESKKQSTEPIPQEDPVLPCETKHGFAFRVEDEKGAKVTDVTASIILVGGATKVVDLSVEALEGNGTWRSPKTLDSGDCTVSFPDLYNAEWWPKGEAQKQFTVNGAAPVADDLDIASIADQLGFRDYKTIWDRSGNKPVIDTRPNPDQLVTGDNFLVPDQQDKSENKATDKDWVFVVKTKHPVKVRVLLVDKDNKPLNGKKWAVSEPVVASGTTKADGVIEFTEIPPQAATAKIKVTMKEPPAPVTPPPAPTPVTPTPYPAAIVATEFTDKHPCTGEDARIVDWELTLGGLASFNAPAGVHARLNNLGFGANVDDDDARITRAVKAYQRFFLKQQAGTGVAKDIEADIRDRHDKP